MTLHGRLFQVPVVFFFLVVAGGLIRCYCRDLKADLVTGSVQEVFGCVLLLKGK